MRILLTGASGTVGKEALDLLSKNRAYEVIVFDVENKRSKAIFRKYAGAITIQYGDIRDIQQVEKACNEIDIVIHLAAIIPPLADEKPEFAREVNEVGTRNLITSIQKYSPNAFFLYSSSVSVYGDRLEDYLINVGDKLQASHGDEYAKTKIAAEKMIQASKLQWSIFRLSAIMGIGNHKMSGLMFHMPLDTKLEIATPRDTARAFVNAIDKQDLLNHRIFNLGGGSTCRLTSRAFMTKNFELAGLGKLDFPPKSFAEKNFHCGYYQDGNVLEEIVNFRQDTLESYFAAVEASISAPQKWITRVLSPLIKRYLSSLSEPLKAFREKDEEVMQRFFNQ